MSYLRTPAQKAIAAQNDSPKAIEALIDDLAFKHVYWTTWSFVTKHPHNVTGKLYQALLSLSKHSKAHIMVVVASWADAEPHIKEHCHLIFAADREIKHSHIRKAWRWGDVKLKPYQPELDGCDYILGKHIQADSFKSTFCPHPHWCAMWEDKRQCQWKTNLPIYRKNRQHYADTKAFQALAEAVEAERQTHKKNLSMAV